MTILWIIAYAMCCAAAFAIIVRDWLSTFGSVTLGDAIFFGGLCVFGPISLAAACAVAGVGKLNRLDRVLWKRKP